jgi:hypothetical protein
VPADAASSMTPFLQAWIVSGAPSPITSGEGRLHVPGLRQIVAGTPWELSLISFCSDAPSSTSAGPTSMVQHPPPRSVSVTRLSNDGMQLVIAGVPLVHVTSPSRQAYMGGPSGGCGASWIRSG